MAICSPLVRLVVGGAVALLLLTACGSDAAESSSISAGGADTSSADDAADTATATEGTDTGTSSVGSTDETDDDPGTTSGRDLDELYEAAQEEGRVVVYENVTPDIVAALEAGFEARYPGIDVEKVRLPDSEMIPRLETELSTGAPTADYVENASPNWLQTMGAEGAWRAAGLSPQATGAGSYDVDRYFDPSTNVYQLGGSVTTFAWNTDLVPDGIEDYTDLLAPEFAGGRVGVIELSSAPGNDFYVWLEDNYGEETYTALGAQAPRIYPSTTGIIEALGSGEISATNWVVPSLLEDAKAAGAPLDWALPPQDRGVFGLLAYGVINAEAENPNAAELYLEYILSEQGQALMWPTASSVLPDVEGTIATNDQLPAFDPERSTSERVEQARQRFDTLFR